MTPRRDRSAGVLLFRRDAAGPRFLLIRSKVTRRPLWEFPKGGIDEGEASREAALRELEEETGVAPGEVQLMDGFEEVERYRFTVGTGAGRTIVHKEVVYYLGETEKRQVKLSPSEASRYEWLSFEEARRRVRYKQRRRILDQARERIEPEAQP